jgi:integrase
VCALRVADLDSAPDRMCIRVVAGKGGKDRYTLLAPSLLEALRRYWRACKHYGEAQALRSARQDTLDVAFLAHPERFKGRRPQPATLPTAVWINPPPTEKTNAPHREPSTVNS